MKEYFYHIIMMLILATLGTALAWWTLRGPERYAALKHIAVAYTPADVRYVSEKWIRDVVHRALPGGKWNVSGIHRVEEQLEQNPFIDNAEVYPGFDGRLHVSVRQFTPVAYVKWGGRKMILDSHGNLTPLPTGAPKGLPVINGIKSEQRLKEIYPVVKYLADTLHFPYKLRRLEADRGDLVLHFGPGIPPLRLGNVHAYRYKLAKAENMYRFLQKKRRLSRYREIDVQYRGQIVCRKP